MTRATSDTGIEYNRHDVTVKLSAAERQELFMNRLAEVISLRGLSLLDSNEVDGMFKIINEIGLENTTELKSVESVLEDILAEDFSDITKWKVAELANVQFIMYEYHGKKCFPSIRVLN